MNNSYYRKAFEISKNAFLIKRNFLAPKGLNTRYITYRILRPFLKIYVKSFRLFTLNSPWLTQGSIIFLRKVLNKDMRGLEYGSGKSTLFFATKLGHLVSIEHDPVWYKIVKKKLSLNGITNVDYMLVKPSNSETKKAVEVRNILGYDHDNVNYQDYYEQLSTFGDEYFDFVIIDGRARVECTQRAIPKIKKGGMLIIDNSERKRYKPIHEMLKDWKSVNTTTGLTDTTIWIKP